MMGWRSVFMALRVVGPEFKYSTKVDAFSVALVEFLFNDNRGVALRVASFSNL